jgi:hypothetical protein
MRKAMPELPQPIEGSASYGAHFAVARRPGRFGRWGAGRPLAGEV